jgi:chromate transporter
MLAVSFTSMICPLLINFAGQELLEIFNLKAIGLFGILLFGIMKFKKHPIIYIAIGAVVGIILKF